MDESQGEGKGTGSQQFPKPKGPSKLDQEGEVKGKDDAQYKHLKNKPDHTQ